MSAPIIFLDMDGVLSSPRAYVAQVDKPHPDCWIDPIAVRYLNMLCQASGALIVVSSSWRGGFSGATFQAMLDRNGFVGRLHNDWRTISRPDGHRGSEVKEWMSRHPEIRLHIILDDESDFDADQPLIKTDITDGFLQEHFSAALKALCPGEEHPMLRAMNGKMGVRCITDAQADR